MCRIIKLSVNDIKLIVNHVKPFAIQIEQSCICFVYNINKQIVSSNLHKD